MSNQIRVSNNEAFVVGKLKEKKLEIKSFDGKQMIAGYLILLCETKYGKGEVRVNLMQNALTKAGEENSLYKGLLTVKNEFKSITETGSIELADLVKIKGQLSDETYYAVKSNGFIEKVGIRGTFVNRIDRVDRSGKSVEDCVKVSLEGSIVDIKPSGEELEVKMIAMGYKGVAIPVSGFIPTELVTAFQTRYQIGNTTTLNFAIVNTVETKEIQAEVGFGEGMGEVIEKFTVKNIIFGGGNIDYNTPYSEEQLKQALASRQLVLDQRKTKAIEKANSTPNMQSGFGTPSNTGGFGVPNNGGFSVPSGGFGV